MDMHLHWAMNGIHIETIVSSPDLQSEYQQKT
jgi:hypothetical protein